MFPYSAAHGKARTLWMLSLRGVLEQTNEPAALLDTAIALGAEEARRFLP
ncbi:MAG: hypothetical protein ACREDR_39040 [Blastocatellia bacterium]